LTEFAKKIVMAEFAEMQERLKRQEAQMEKIHNMLQKITDKPERESHSAPIGLGTVDLEKEFKIGINQRDPTDTLKEMYEKGGPWTFEFTATDRKAVESLIPKTEKTPELSADLWAYVKKDTTRKAKAAALYQSMLALGNVFNALKELPSLLADTQSNGKAVNKAVNATLLMTAMEMTKFSRDLRNVGREAIEAPKIQTEEKTILTTEEDELYLTRKRKREDLTIAMKPIAAARGGSYKKPRGGGYKGRGGGKDQTTTFVSKEEAPTTETSDTSGGRASGRGRGRGRGGRGTSRG
jgi:hypothetical protein